MDFGGAWTEKKKKAVQHYLKCFVVALKNQSFPKYYIDAFAGTGYHHLEQEETLFGEDNDNEMEDLHRGSASIALGSDPSFDRYFFIEISPKKIRSLKGMASKYPNKNVDFIQNDANDALMKICEDLVRIHINIRPRCVVFLDPFGTEVKWATLECLARTKVCDIWYLFPTNAINRMLANKGRIPEAWKSKLNEVFGTDGWEERFYIREEENTLFGEGWEVESGKKPNPLKEIQDYVYSRLTQIFGYACCLI